MLYGALCPKRVTHWGRNKINDIIADEILKYIFPNGMCDLDVMSQKFILKDSIKNIPELAQFMAWSRLVDKPVSEPKMIIWLTHICVTRPKWVDD